MPGERLLTLVAALFGASGVALSAAAAHGGTPSLASAAEMLLVHAAALVGLSALVATGRVHRKAALVAGGGMSVGVLLFSGTLSLVAFAGVRPFPMAAPTGGTLTILGWLGLAVAALLRPR
ncbi:DUF423 domain-containing protein [Alsobacter sp. R-9]